LPNSTSGWSERRETFKQIRRFLVIGVLSVLVDLAVYLILTRLGLSTHLSKGISYVSGMVLGFIGNKFWTFESARRSASEPTTYLLLYAATLLVNVAVNATVLAMFADVLPPRWNKAWAFLVATGVTTVLNFLGMRFVTFFRGVRQRREKIEAAFPKAENSQALSAEEKLCN
jgi:putative flippase GtrA